MRTLNNFEPLTPTVYKTAFRLLDGSFVDERTPFDGHRPLNPHRVNKAVLDLLAVRYVLVDSGLTGEWEESANHLGLEKVPIGGADVALYENPGARPRASLVSSAVPVGSEEQAARIIADPAFDPGRVVVVQDPPGRAIPAAGAVPRASPDPPPEVTGSSVRQVGGGRVRILQDDADRVALEARVPPGPPMWLVLMDLDFPGWQATVDGRPATIRPADLVGRTIMLHPGSHRVVFRYEDRLFALGCWLALGTAGAWGLVFLAAGVRKWRGQS
jgi:hypothetical protein